MENISDYRVGENVVRINHKNAQRSEFFEVIWCAENEYPRGNLFGVRGLSQTLRDGNFISGMVFRRRGEYFRVIKDKRKFKRQKLTKIEPQEVAAKMSGGIWSEKLLTAAVPSTSLVSRPGKCGEKTPTISLRSESGLSAKLVWCQASFL